MEGQDDVGREPGKVENGAGDNDSQAKVQVISEIPAALPTTEIPDIHVPPLNPSEVKVITQEVENMIETTVIYANAEGTIINPDESGIVTQPSTSKGTKATNLPFSNH